MTKFKPVRWAFVVLTICGLAGISGRAADDNAAPAKIAPVGRIALGSATQIYKLAEELGLPVPDSIKPEGVEQMLPFLGQGGFNPDLPLAMDFLGGGDLTQSQRALMFIPVNAGHAPIGDFLKNGGDKLGDDGAIVNNTPMRRVGDYLLMGSTAEFIANAKPDDLVKQLSDHPLLYLQYDAKKLRELMPDLKAQFKATLPKTAKTQAEQAGEDLVYNAMFDALDNLVVRLDKKPDALRLTAQIQPTPQLSQNTFKLSGMPEGVAARIDCQTPDGWVKPGMDWLRKAVGDEEIFKDTGADTPEQRTQFMALLSDAFEAMLGGDQASVGVGVNDGEIVGYIITQAGKPRSSHDDWSAMLDRAKRDLPNAGGDASDMKLSDYTTAAGDRITRLTFVDKAGTPWGQMDSFDRGSIRFEVLSRPNVNAMEKLLACQPAGTLDISAKGFVDLKAVCDLLPLIPDSTISKPSDADEALLTKVLGGQRIEFSFSSDTKNLTLQTDVPFALLKNLVANGAEFADVLDRLASHGAK